MMRRRAFLAALCGFPVADGVASDMGTRTLTQYLTDPNSRTTALGQAMLEALTLPNGVELDPTGETDNASELQDYANWCAQNGFDMVLPRGGTVLVGTAVTLPNGVGLVGNGCTLKARSGLSGDAVLKLGTSTAFEDYHQSSGIRDLVIDCNEVANAVAIAAINCRQTTISNILVKRAVTDGIVITTGYQVRVENFEIVGSSPIATFPGASLPSADAAGIVCHTSDCSFAKGAVQHFACGGRDVGGGNVWEDVHAWSTYWSNDIPMYRCFECSGDGSIFANCIPDSPVMVTNEAGQTPSHLNGGLGFDISGDRVAVTNARLVVSQHGDALPVDNSIALAYIDSEYVVIEPWIVTDLAGDKFYTPNVVANTFSQLQTATITPGSAIAFMPQNSYVANAYGAGTATLYFGGSASSGWAASFNQARYLKQGPATTVYVRLILTEKGSGTGDLSLSELPFFPPVFDRQFVNVLIKNGNHTVPVVGHLAPNQNTVDIVSAVDGSALDNTDLNDNSEIDIWGTIFSLYQSTDGT